MTTLYRLIDSCGEVRIEIGGPAKYRILEDHAIGDILNAFEARLKLQKIVTWLEANQPDVFKRGLWDAINVDCQAVLSGDVSAIPSEGAKG